MIMQLIIKESLQRCFGNKYESIEKENATRKLFEMIFKVMKTVNISDENINHIIRTLRSFLEGFSLLVNNNAFGNPVSIKESFSVSILGHSHLNLE